MPAVAHMDSSSSENFQLVLLVNLSRNRRISKECAKWLKMKYSPLTYLSSHSEFDDEEPDIATKQKAGPVKWRDLPSKKQLAILIIARLSEPLSQTSLQAYMFYQLKSFNPTYQNQVSIFRQDCFKRALPRPNSSLLCYGDDSRMLIGVVGRRFS